MGFFVPVVVVVSFLCTQNSTGKKNDKTILLNDLTSQKSMTTKYSNYKIAHTKNSILHAPNETVMEKKKKRNRSITVVLKNAFFSAS